MLDGWRLTLSQRLRDAWRALRFARSSGRAEALHRVAFALVLVIQLVWLRENVVVFYSSESVWRGKSLPELYTPELVTLAFWVWFASAVLLLIGSPRGLVGA